MIVELRRFLSFGDGWWKGPVAGTREACEWDDMLLNTDYVGFVRRYLVRPTFALTEVGLVDWQQHFVFDITYEDMRELLRKARGSGIPTASEILGSSKGKTPGC